MGLTVAEFDKFKTVITANAKEMKMFGSTAAEGVKTFAKVSGELYKSEMGKTLELMGITAEEQYEQRWYMEMSLQYNPDIAVPQATFKFQEDKCIYAQFTNESNLFYGCIRLHSNHDKKQILLLIDKLKNLKYLDLRKNIILTNIENY